MKWSIVVLILLIFGCSKPTLQNDYLEFEARNYLAWFSTFKIDFLWKEGKAIRGVPLTWVSLMRIEFMEEDAKSSRVHCLNYRLPHLKKGQTGTLKVVEISKNELCQNSFFESSFSELARVEKFNFSINNYTLSLNIKMKSQKEEIALRFPLMNLESPEQFTKEKFANSATIRKNIGVSYWPLKDGTLQSKSKILEVKMQGEIDSSFPDHTTIKCQTIDDNCSLVGKSTCDRCRYGWFEVIDSRCSTRFSRYCGPNRCGEKGWPACLRGNEHFSTENEQVCFTGSKVGFCKKGLTTHCNSGTLICL